MFDSFFLNRHCFLHIVDSKQWLKPYYSSGCSLHRYNRCESDAAKTPFKEMRAATTSKLNLVCGPFPLLPQECPTQWNITHELGKSMSLKALIWRWIPNDSFAKLLCDPLSGPPQAKLWPPSHVWAYCTLGPIHALYSVVRAIENTSGRWTKN